MSLKLYIKYFETFVWLLCLWDSLDKNTSLCCRFFLQGVFLTQGQNLHLLHWQSGVFTIEILGKPILKCLHIYISCAVHSPPYRETHVPRHETYMYQMPAVYQTPPVHLTLSTNAETCILTYTELTA